MPEKHNKRSQKHLFNLIRMRNENTPNFALLLGAGASISSGVKSTTEMIAEWRRQLHLQSSKKDAYDKWLAKQNWYRDDEEYSLLFEKVYDRPSQRRIYIEECIGKSRPSWGYIYTANLIANNFFNVVFTPNFDDLLNESCFLYADCRPLVCAHDSAVSDIRVTSARPKIIKLHGDFLYDSIKNTIRETESLEQNMREKFMQFAREYGLIVIGYGGGDRSIMDILDTMLRSGGYFPHGLYWCIREDHLPNRKVERLLSRENTYWVEIDGFDEFMAELNEFLGLALPMTVRDPYKATTQRLNGFISKRDETKHRVIQKDILVLEGQVKAFERILLAPTLKGKTRVEHKGLIAYGFLGDAEFNRHNYSKALEYYEKMTVDEFSGPTSMRYAAYSYSAVGKSEKALKMAQEVVKRYPESLSHYVRGYCYAFLGKLKEALSDYDNALSSATTDKERHFAYYGKAKALVRCGALKEALAEAEKSLTVADSEGNKLQALLAENMIRIRLGETESARKAVKSLLQEIKNHYDRAVAFAILADRQKMLEELEMSIKEDEYYRVRARIESAFSDYFEDESFQRILSKKE